MTGLWKILREWQSVALDRQYRGRTALERVISEARARTLKDVMDLLEQLGIEEKK